MPFAFVFRRYAPFATFGLGFEGDNRSGPSISLSATARTIGCVPFEPGSVGLLAASSSGSEYAGGGGMLRHFLGRHTSKVRGSVVVRVQTSSRLAFTAQTAGANPMLPKAPDIDTFVDVEIDFVGNSLRFRGTLRGDDFPNAEVFVLDAKGTGCLLFDGRTTGGQDTGPMTRLAGDHSSQRLGAFSSVVGLARDGNFLAPKTSCAKTMMSAPN